MKKVYKERLLKLADFLVNIVPKKHFDLNYFTRDHDSHDPDDFTELLKKLQEIKKDFKPHKCGAVACAVGWMPAVFPRSLMWNKEASVVLRNHKNRDYPDADFDAAEDFLGLTENQTQQLFTADYYPKGRRGPKSVANKIKHFVNTGRLSEKQYEVEIDEFQV